MGGGYGGPPKSRTGLWLTIGGGLLGIGIVALLVTGFIAPGFLLSKGPDDIVDDAVAAMNSKDIDAMRSTMCDPSKLDGADNGDQNEEVTVSRKGEVEHESDTRASALLELDSNEGIDFDLRLVLVERDGEWCVEDT
jgi:hypothetical protein